VKRIEGMAVLGAAALLASLFGSGCAALAPLPAVGAKTADGWTVAYASDFNEPKLPKAWFVVDGEAKVADGALTLIAEADSQGQVVLEKPKAPGSVRVDIVAWLTGEALSDISTVLNCDGTGYASGYILQFGGVANTQNRLLKLGEVVESTAKEAPLVSAGVKYCVSARNDGGKISLLVDGKEVFAHKDSAPMTGNNQAQIGLYTWGCTLHVDRIVVYKK